MAALKLPALFIALRGVKALPQEILAGITLAALMIPLNIGYAQVAGLPPVVGLYGAIVPMLAYAIFSTSRNVVASPDAAIAAIMGGLLMTMAAPADPRYVQLALALALLCALIFFLFWVFKLGFLANFLSRAVLIGFVSGMGIEVFVSQIKKIMGVSLEAEGFFREIVELISKLPIANLYSVAIGVGSIAIIRLLKRYAPKVPGALIALAVMTIIVAAFNLDQRGVSVLGAMPPGLPAFAFPHVSLADYFRLIPGALAICGVTLAEGLLLARKYAQKYRYSLDTDQESLAYGAANIAAGLTGALVLGSSASRTAAMEDAGARSQWPSVVAAIVVAIVLLFFSGLLALLPNAALGGIVANAVLSLIEVHELRALFQVRRSEFWIAVVALLSVLVLGALPAVAIAFLLSTIDVVRRAASPKTAVLKEYPDGFFNSDDTVTQTEPGLTIYRFGASLFFANASLFLEQVKQLAGHADPPLRWFVLNAEMINDIDTTGAEALEQAIGYLHERGIVFAISRAHAPVPALLARYDLLHEIGQDHLFATNRDVVDAFRRVQNVPDASARAGDKL